MTMGHFMEKALGLFQGKEAIIKSATSHHQYKLYLYNTQN